MSAAVMTNRLELSSVADTALKSAAQFWFAVTVVGQVVFGLTVASFYALTALRGDCHKWSFTNGYVPSSSGNTAVVMHVASAAIVMLARAVQLVPQVRKRFPAFHRWNGRATYNFNEDELNNLGYELIRAKKFQEPPAFCNSTLKPIRNPARFTTASGKLTPTTATNHWPSPTRKSLELNPKNRGAVVWLRKLNAP